MVEKLCNEYKLTTVATLNSNHKHVPKEFKNVAGREVKGSIFAWNGNCMLVSYVPKEGRNVLMILSMHDQPIISEAEA